MVDRAIYVRYNRVQCPPYRVFFRQAFSCIFSDFSNFVEVSSVQLSQLPTTRNYHGIKVLACIAIKLQRIWHRFLLKNELSNNNRNQTFSYNVQKQITYGQWMKGDSCLHFLHLRVQMIHPMKTAHVRLDWHSILPWNNSQREYTSETSIQVSKKRN